MSTNTTFEVTSLTVDRDCYLQGTFVTGGIITPTTISSTPQNDYSPTGLSNASIIRISASTPINITGLTGGISGRRITFINTDPISITLQDENSGSAAANRFSLGGINANLVKGAVVGMIYDGSISRWRIQTATAGAATPGGLVQSVWAEALVDVSTSTTTWPTTNTAVRIATALPAATIPALSVTGFPATGTLRILNSAGDYQTVTYTSITGGATPTFNGASGGTGTIPVASVIWLYPTQTTIAAGSNGAVLPQGTINVASTTNFPASGTIIVATTDNGTQKVTYTGIGATTFTGCTGGVGTMATGGQITDITATSQDLIRLELTSQGGFLIIQSAASVSTTNNQIAFFQITLDGFVLRGGAASGNGGAPGGSTVIGLKLSNVAAGFHVAVLRWRVSAGTSSLFPVTLAEQTNVNMLIQEVSS